LSGLSLKLIENGLKREELVALNSTLLHELYFASMGGDGKVTNAMFDALARDFGSVQRWRTEFSAMGYALGGGSGWVLLTWIPRDGRLINQYSSEYSQSIANGMPLLALDMYEHAYHIDFGANAMADVDTFLRNVDWKAVEGRYEDASTVAPPRPLVQEEFGDLPGIGVEEVRAMLQREAGGGVLCVWLPRRLPHRDHVARRGFRCPLHDSRPLRLEGHRRAGQDEHMTRARRWRSVRVRMRTDQVPSRSGRIGVIAIRC
jgi:superoxide dismutase